MATTKKNKFSFLLPIGDWSSDGHEKCEYFTVESNKKLEYVREIHFNIEEKTGIDIHSFANDYDDSTIPKDVETKLKNLGYVFHEEIDYGEEHFASPEEMVRIWIFLLMKTDKKLKLTLKNEKDMLPFYGSDKKKRHISFVGYGCFY